MSDVTFISCQRCGAEGDIELPPRGTVGPLVCPQCDALVNMISVAAWHEHIERRVAGFAERQRTGSIGSRKQAMEQSDIAIDRDGLQAELAACLLLCPGMRNRWLTTGGPNRGNDLPPDWTLLPTPTEVKQTRYCDDRRGCLIVRPPRRTPGPMRAEYIDDCVYVLMHGQHGGLLGPKRASPRDRTASGTRRLRRRRQRVVPLFRIEHPPVALQRTHGQLRVR